MGRAMIDDLAELRAMVTRLMARQLGAGLLDVTGLPRVTRRTQVTQIRAVVAVWRALIESGMSKAQAAAQCGYDARTLGNWRGV